ncbi:MAG TPA: CinA family protein [Pilimelia sp.]|nr:CinA family protein [Pilimelia sp.]
MGTTLLPEEIVADLLRQRSLTLATAESLTGGMLGELVTSVPGASTFYLGGMITYATEAKRDVLGVSPDTLGTEGPVSCRTACEMAARVSERFGSAIGVSTTGVAGPTMQDGHPVGTLYVGLSYGGRVRCLPFHGPGGSRDEIRRWAARTALDAVVRAVRDPERGDDR